MSPDHVQCLSKETEAGGENGLMDLPMSLPCPEMGRKLYGQHSFNSMAQQAASLQREKGYNPGTEPGTQTQYSSGQGEHLCRATPGLLKKQ